jgi:hypothetical protein
MKKPMASNVGTFQLLLKFAFVTCLDEFCINVFFQPVSSLEELV